MTKLSDDQWNKIAKATGLPLRARSVIEIDTWVYIGWTEVSSRAPAALRLELRTLRQELFRTAERLESLSSSLLLRKILIDPELRKENLNKVSVDDLRDSGLAVDRMIAKLPPTKRGPKSDSAYWLISTVARRIEEFTGRETRRSDASRRMFEELFAVVDPTVGPGTIDWALRALTKRAGGEAPSSAGHAVSSN